MTPTTTDLLHAAASVAIAAGARLQDLAVAIERGQPARELARTAEHAAKLAKIALADVGPVLRSIGRVRR